MSASLMKCVSRKVRIASNSVWRGASAWLPSARAAAGAASGCTGFCVTTSSARRSQKGL
jgi:hypothetical protein